LLALLGAHHILHVSKIRVKHSVWSSPSIKIIYVHNIKRSDFVMEIRCATYRVVTWFLCYLRGIRAPLVRRTLGTARKQPYPAAFLLMLHFLLLYLISVLQSVGDFLFLYPKHWVELNNCIENSSDTICPKMEVSFST
jgi:hypothetical protein